MCLHILTGRQTDTYIHKHEHTHHLLGTHKLEQINKILQKSWTTQDTETLLEKPSISFTQQNYSWEFCCAFYTENVAIASPGPHLI